MRGRLPVVPLALSVACAAAIVVGATSASGAPLPAPAMQPDGHWVVNAANSAALHVHGGTGQVDARVDLPPDAASEGSDAVAGGPEGFVVGRDRVWTFDGSTLTVTSDTGAAADEVPVPIEVVGGPYLVYRRAGTVVRLGAPAAVVEAGGPLGPPVRTAAGTVAVHRPDTGAVCALHRDAPGLDCGISTAPGAAGGLSVVGGTVVFVDTGADVAFRVLFGAGLDGGTPLGTDLPADALLGDQAVGARLPVLLPGGNVLRLVDVGGLEGLRPGGAPIDVPLGEGAFSAPVVGDSAIALLDVAGGRLLTFGPDGARISETRLPPGSSAEDLSRGADGRVYLDEVGGGRVHVVQPGGAVTTVEVGDGTGAAVAAAPPPELLAAVRPPPPGAVEQPAAGVPTGDELPGAPALAAPGPPVPGAVPVGGAPVAGAPVPGVEPPPVDPPPVDPQVPEVEEPEPALPGAPTALVAARQNLSGTVLVELAWAAPVDGAVPAVGYEVTTTGEFGSGTARIAEAEFRDYDNYCARTVSYEVRSVGANGATSAPAVVSADDPDADCTPFSDVLSAVPGPDGSATVEVECHSTGNGNYQNGDVSLVVDGDVVGGSQECRKGGSADRSLHTFTAGGLAPGSTHTVQSRTVGITGTKTSPAVTVTVP